MAEKTCILKIKNIIGKVIAIITVLIKLIFGKKIKDLLLIQELVLLLEYQGILLHFLIVYLCQKSAFFLDLPKVIDYKLKLRKYAHFLKAYLNIML